MAENGQPLLPAAPVAVVNNFHAQPVRRQDFRAPILHHRQTTERPKHRNSTSPRVIECFDGQLITARRDMCPPVENGFIVPDLGAATFSSSPSSTATSRTCRPPWPSSKGFGLKHGALASSVGHDSHNITAVGCDDASLARAVNLVIAAKGGLAAVGANGEELLLPLPVAGLMSDQSRARP